MKNKLEKFLINRGAYEKFKNNLKNLTRYKVDVYLRDYGKSRNAISNPFTWSLSPESMNYWARLSEEWEEIYEDENKL